jgi:hypothetical protein
MPLVHEATQTTSKSEANVLTLDQFHNTCLTIQLEEKQLNQCFNITQDQDFTIEEAQALIKDIKI